MHKIIGLIISLVVGLSVRAQVTVNIEVLDFQNKPFQYMDLGIDQLQVTQTTDQSGICKFDKVPPGVYALTLDYKYDIEYRTLKVYGQDTSIRIYLDRRIEFEEILIKAQQLELSNHSNASLISSLEIKNFSTERDLPFILESTPGLWAQSDAGNGVGYTGFRFRGLSPGQIQVNLNGIPFNDAESSLSYFVDIPDIASSTESIMIFRGNVPSRPGTPSFGGAIDIQTNKLQFEPSINLQSTLSSYGGFKYGAQLNSGLIANAYHIEFGFSKQISDGFIDRSASKLKSFRFSAGIVKPKYAIRLNYFSGNENTGQAWYGLPAQYLEVDSLRRFNLAGTAKPGLPYTDEIDQYAQDHVQLFYQRQISAKLNFSWITNYTAGKGFYRNYRAGVLLESFGISSINKTEGDLTTRKWLDNDFLFTNLAFAYSVNPSLIIRPVLAYSYYNGNHFGDVDKVFLDEYELTNYKYYSNTGIKKELSSAIKTEFAINSKLSCSTDFQYRTVNYMIEGSEEVRDSLDGSYKFSFFSPKAFLSYTLNQKTQINSSVGLMQREPFRADIIANKGTVDHERLIDLELGLNYFHSGWLRLNVNAFAMYYPSLNALSGELDEVGEALRIKLTKVSNIGIEWDLDVQILDFLELSHSACRSWTAIPKWQETIPNYGPGWEILPLESAEHRNAALSYSPEWVSRTVLKYWLVKGKKQLKRLGVNFSHQLVSEFYLDNSSRTGSLHEGYSVQDIGLNATMNLIGKSEFVFWIKVHNLFNTKYSSHGWISRFKHQGQVDLNSDPYLVNEGNQHYAYKAYFPQANRHFSIGIQLLFN